MDKSWLIQFGKNLKALRESKHFSKNHTAKLIGVSANAYDEYEKGNREPALTIVKDIALSFTASLDKLILSDYTNAEIFWVNNGYEVEHLNNGKIQLILPVPSNQHIIENGEITYLQAKQRAIRFSDIASFITFTENVQKKHATEYIAKINEDVLSLYHNIQDGKAKYNATIEEKNFEQVYTPLK